MQNLNAYTYTPVYVVACERLSESPYLHQQWNMVSLYSYAPFHAVFTILVNVDLELHVHVFGSEILKELI